MLSIVFSRARVQGELLSETFTCAQRTGEPIEEDVEARKFCTVLPTAENNCTICQLFVMLWCLLKVSIGFHPFSALINHNYQSRLPTFAGKKSAFGTALAVETSKRSRPRLFSEKERGGESEREREREREREQHRVYPISTYYPRISLPPCHLSPKNGEHPSISTIHCNHSAVIAYGHCPSLSKVASGPKIPKRAARDEVGASPRWQALDCGVQYVVRVTRLLDIMKVNESMKGLI